ncbi:MAG: hypothetical protein IT584_01855 [Chlamydiae bacterium]|nr:hypothetical protein [Chlamydiota bacterium]
MRMFRFFTCMVGSCLFALAGTTLLINPVLDMQDRKVMERSSPRTVDRMDRGEPLTLGDIIKLSQSGINDSTIVQYMQMTKSTYHLSQTQVRRLQDAGVSQSVIDHMVQSGTD